MHQQFCFPPNQSNFGWVHLIITAADRILNHARHCGTFQLSESIQCFQFLAPMHNGGWKSKFNNDGTVWLKHTVSEYYIYNALLTLLCIVADTPLLMFDVFNLPVCVWKAPTPAASRTLIKLYLIIYFLHRPYFFCSLCLLFCLPLGE